MKNWLKDAANVAPLLPPNLTLGPLLADGGQGVVYSGTANGAPAAIKLYVPGQVEKRIEREVAALHELACPSIVRPLWHGIVQAQGQDLHVVATEFVHGAPLHDVLAGERALGGGELGVLCFDVAEAIGAMWKRRIVHRDLKPGNILLRQNGRACVIDLGLARHLDESSLTAAGMTWGTRGYLSPEQAQCAKALSCKSDVFALGVVLLEAASGTHPTGRDQNRLLAQPFHQTLVPALAAWAHADLVRRMLDPDPYRRPLPPAILTALAAFHP
ncbi:MAG: serine/threonine-protein kinase [Deltaproteobacteria bacterium]|nr:serine/threonine-protein kinase [Deltaproteobacteria bacterium]